MYVAFRKRLWHWPKQTLLSESKRMVDRRRNSGAWFQNCFMERPWICDLHFWACIWTHPQSRLPMQDNQNWDCEVNIILLMVLMHLLSDYTLQGWLAQAKSISWWKQNAPDKKFKNDWMAALICHSLYWAILTFIPLYRNEHWFYFVLGNTVLHCIIDDLKCNRKKINLIEDQFLHLVQIIATFLVFG